MCTSAYDCGTSIMVRLHFCFQNGYSRDIKLKLLKFEISKTFFKASHRDCRNLINLSNKMFSKQLADFFKLIKIFEIRVDDFFLKFR